jgi:peptidoglycan/LPS O-acetylase OafA/YrhL
MGRYLPQLDGLRAVAVLLVIGAHTGLARGGYVGVDVFFVLSGYLITNILVRERETGRWSIRRFYVRRIRRLYPALLLMLLLTLPFDGTLMPGDEFHRLAVVFLSATYLANFGNLHPTHWMGGLGHTWSLAVEEQFYLLWPFALPLVIRFRRGQVGLAMVTVAMLSMLAFGPLELARLLLGSGGALLAGCLLALILNGRTLPRSGTLAAASACAITAMVLVAPTGFDPHAGLESAAVSVAAVPLIAGLVSGGVLSRCLSARPMVWLGQRSYGIYLWHFPLLVLFSSSGLLPPKWEILMAVAAAISAAALSYSLVEQRFRYPRKDRPLPAAAAVQAAPALAE